MDTKKHVVQVGLHNTAEYRFLASRFTDEKRNEPRPLPYELSLEGNWIFHGVECHPESIKNFKDTETDKYYQYAITDQASGTIEVGDFRKRRSGERIIVPSRTLESFFAEAGIPHCHLLILDIEGWEYRAIEAYTGEIPIDFMIVEYHHRYFNRYPPVPSEADFEKLSAEKGFEIIAKYKANLGDNLEIHLKRT